jgi:hypothetical protein
LSTTYQQPVLPISDPQAYGAVRSAIEQAYSSNNVANFLRSLERGNVRIRNFEQVVGKGLLGAPIAAAYAKLENGDQGQIREFYLASLERVAPELRDKFFKLYAYY